jgi:hypothetical protein
VLSTRRLNRSMETAFSPLLLAAGMDGALGVWGEGESIMLSRSQTVALVLGVPVLALAPAATASADTICAGSHAGEGSTTVQKRAEAA